MEFLNDDEYINIFVLDNFDGDIFTKLKRERCRVIGSPAVIETAQNAPDLSQDEVRKCQRTGTSNKKKIQVV